jgi:hypothetical protein
MDACGSLSYYSQFPFGRRIKRWNFYGSSPMPPAPQGFEDPVRKLLVETIKPYVSSIHFDGLGSILAT